MTGTECQGVSCCASILVPGGSFAMGSSTVATDPGYSNVYEMDETPEHTATVSEFRLDKFEVTVGRFRRLVDAYDAWRTAGNPASGAGANPKVAGSGWSTEWISHLPANATALTGQLKCRAGEQNWTDVAGSHEQFPINCVNWYVAQAFAIWDGGRLPTEAEWEYAAAGGEENRLYPWGRSEPSSSLANYYYSNRTSKLPVGSKPAGAGRWGHLDLAGSMWEWVFDWYEAGWYQGFTGGCADCCNVSTYLPARPHRGTRGGAFTFNGFIGSWRAAERQSDHPGNGAMHSGFRVARAVDAVPTIARR